METSYDNVKENKKHHWNIEQNRSLRKNGISSELIKEVGDDSCKDNTGGMDGGKKLSHWFKATALRKEGVIDCTHYRERAWYIKYWKLLSERERYENNYNSLQAIQRNCGRSEM